VTIVAATKYVSVEDMAVLREAGIDVVGENRAQDLEAKHAAYGDAFHWHFIGHLQSRKAKAVSQICELVHSLDSESAAKRLEVPALVQVNLAGEASKSGVAPERLDEFLELYPQVRGLSFGNCVSWPRNTASQSFQWARARTTRSPRKKEQP